MLTCNFGSRLLWSFSGQHQVLIKSLILLRTLVLRVIGWSLLKHP
ncbi:hypothetical protein HanPI659440_Chr04g0147891 [Helianthus annuus]|nr:hypothetical protein HanPI659440_Chr04g0147891 [Helianthus annuus]